LKKEKHDECTQDIGYHNDKGYKLFLEIYFIQEKKIDLTGFACGLKEVYVL
jgi:hypothetical protein